MFILVHAQHIIGTLDLAGEFLIIILNKSVFFSDFVNTFFIHVYHIFSAPTVRKKKSLRHSCSYTLSGV